MKKESGYKKALQEFYVEEQKEQEYSLYQDLVQNIIPQQILWILITQICQKSPQKWKEIFRILRERNIEELCHDNQYHDAIEEIIHSAFDDIEEDVFKGV